MFCLLAVIARAVGRGVCLHRPCFLIVAFSFSGLKLANVREEIYAVGGYSGIDYLKTVEKYDPIQDSWSHAHNMITEKSSFALATLPKGSDRVLRASQFEVLFHGEI